MRSVKDVVDDAASRTGFSGVVRLDRAGETELSAAYGFADRGHGIANTVETQFATASGTKTLTALAVMALVERGTLGLGTTARSLLGDDLPLVADDVTVEHLLAHRSGIGDYFDEEAVTDITDYVMTVPVHELATTEQYLPGPRRARDPCSRPGERFSYNNGGYVVLALLAERASGVGFHDLVRTLVCEPAGMVDTAFLRSDELPGRRRPGLPDRRRPAHQRAPPPRGRERGRRRLLDGRPTCTACGSRSTPDGSSRRSALAEMLRPHSDWPEENSRYGLGFHLHATTDTAWLEGYDAGVSFASVHRPSSATTYTVMSNWTDGAWPMVDVVSDALDG